MFCQSICHIHLEGIAFSPTAGGWHYLSLQKSKCPLTLVLRTRSWCNYIGVLFCVDKLIFYGSLFSLTTFQPYVVESSILAKMNVCDYLFMLFFYKIVDFFTLFSVESFAVNHLSNGIFTFYDKVIALCNVFKCWRSLICKRIFFLLYHFFIFSCVDLLLRLVTLFWYSGFGDSDDLILLIPLHLPY